MQDLVETLDSAVTQSGKRLVELSQASLVLLVFLRHAGCTFCREALADIAKDRRDIEARSARIILVHMADSQEIETLLEKHGLARIDRICDSEQKLYRAFGLGRGTAWQLAGPKVLWRAVGALWRHGIGLPIADGFQMPGVFLIENATIVGRFRHRSAADRPDYAGICRGGQ